MKVGCKSFHCDSVEENTHIKSRNWQKSTQPNFVICQVECYKVVRSDLNDSLLPTAAEVSETDEEFLNDLKFLYKGKAHLGNQTVDYMRDARSTLTIFRDKFIMPHEYTGNKVSV